MNMEAHTESGLQCSSPTAGIGYGETMTNDFLIAGNSYNNLAQFDVRFSRSYRLLHFIACRVLGGPERADEAVENCWSTASRNPPRFEYEGEFRSWLLRVVIDEALAILRNAPETFAAGASREDSPHRYFCEL